MKRIIGILFIACLMTSCHKDHAYQIQGTLTGLDLTKCACCGGVYLTIDNDPAGYRIFALPSMTNQQLENLTFPQRIKLDYHSGISCGSMGRLDVTRYVFD